MKASLIPGEHQTDDPDHVQETVGGDHHPARGLHGPPPHQRHARPQVQSKRVRVHEHHRRRGENLYVLQRYLGDLQTTLNTADQLT